MPVKRSLIKFFSDGIGIRFWHHFGKPNGTGIRLCRYRSGLIGIRYSDGRLYFGLWKVIGFDLIELPENRFDCYRKYKD